ncbi:PTS sugar transporter subunit IIA [Faecalicoccus pleomorphus]|uniref:PTS sugar transporter subunit IIA n=1 Tax=Faecalicoccus pleomorphus TaxID=1323 RepID=UPI0039F4EC4E
MCRLLLLSHSELSKSFYQTIELIMGKPSPKISYLTLPYGQDMDMYQQMVEEQVLESECEGILILTDLFGGSPFMISTRVYEKYCKKNSIEIICGMNLSMVVEVASALKQNLSLDVMKQIALDSGHKGIVDFSELLSNTLPKRKENEK